MPNRMLRDWTQSDKIDLLTADAERFFTRMIMKADDYGCFWGDTRLLKANLYPLKLDKVREADISRWIAECVKAGLILFYEVGQKKYVQIIDFGQRLDKARPKFPLPSGSQNQDESSKVYLMFCKALDLYKIGVSKNPWARLKEVSKKVQSETELRFSYEGTTDDERNFHIALQSYRLEGEWFNLPTKIVDCFSGCYSIGKDAKSTLIDIRSCLVVNYAPAESERSCLVVNYAPAESESETKSEPEKKNTNTLSGFIKPVHVIEKPEYLKLQSTFSEKEQKQIYIDLKTFIEENRPSFAEPYADLWNMYANKHGLSQLKGLTEKRIKKVQTRSKEALFNFPDILEKIRLSPFYRGENSNWKATFDYVFESETNYLKILES